MELFILQKSKYLIYKFASTVYCFSSRHSSLKRPHNCFSTTLFYLLLAHHLTTQIKVSFLTDIIRNANSEIARGGEEI